MCFLISNTYFLLCQDQKGLTRGTAKIFKRKENTKVKKAAYLFPDSTSLKTDDGIPIINCKRNVRFHRWHKKCAQQVVDLKNFLKHRPHLFILNGVMQRTRPRNYLFNLELLAFINTRKTTDFKGSSLNLKSLKKTISVIIFISN